MFEDIKNITIKYVNVATSVKAKKIRDRTSHLFAFRLDGEGYFDFGDKVIESKKGDVVFLPKDSSYDHFLETEKCMSLRIGFLADIENPVPKAYSSDGFHSIHKIINELPVFWRNNDPASYHKCLSMFHELIAFFIEQDEKSYEAKTNYRIIKPAVEYLKEHTFDADLDINVLPDLCRISPSYFRRIFLENFKISPKKYVEEKRLDYANMLIKSGEFNTVYEVAENVGYNDPLYFGRVFKKKFGISPSYIRTRKE